MKKPIQNNGKQISSNATINIMPPVDILLTTLAPAVELQKGHLKITWPRDGCECGNSGPGGTGAASPSPQFMQYALL